MPEVRPQATEVQSRAAKTYLESKYIQIELWPQKHINSSLRKHFCLFQVWSLEDNIGFSWDVLWSSSSLS
jgi:hypothetical protein